MQAFRHAGVDEIEVLPVLIVSQAFPARPSSVPDIRDFVRERLAKTPLSADDVRTLCQRVADVLLDAAGTNGMIQVSLRMFPDYAEVDVLQANQGEEAGGAGMTGTSAASGPRRPVRAAGGPGGSGGPNGNGGSAAVRGTNGGAPGRPGGTAGFDTAAGSGKAESGTAAGSGATAAPAPAVVGSGVVAGSGVLPASARPDVSFAEWLADALRREGMTMEAAARQLKVSVKTVSRWVGGATEPRLRDLSRIREIFGDLPFP